MSKNNMENIGPKTKKNLEEAFAGESMARNKYTYWASIAKKAGFIQISNIFLETAENEKEHAKLWAKRLGLIKEIEEVLQDAIDGEHYENVEMYPKMAEEAEEEGHADIAAQFRKVAEAEIAHETRYKKLLQNIKDKKVFKKDSVVKWKCNNCGYLHEGDRAPVVCPTCAHPIDHFELFVETY